VGQPNDAPFRFLHEARMDELADRLAREHSQTIAVVLAYLPPARAAEALAALAPAVQVEVMRRLATMEPADAVVVREIEDALRHWIAPAMDALTPSVGMLAAQRIISSTDGATQRHLLDALSRQDTSLAVRLGREPDAAVAPSKLAPVEPQHWSFANVERLPDADLARLWTQVDRQVGVLALAAASPEFIDRVVDAVDEPLARAICRDLDELGPVVLADLDEAQRKVAALASSLCTLPAGGVA
jgi:flagellar motor switch protein FliG